jgi:hypothetical protein
MRAPAGFSNLTPGVRHYTVKGWRLTAQQFPRFYHLFMKNGIKINGLSTGCLIPRDGSFEITIVHSLE